MERMNVLVDCPRSELDVEALAVLSDDWDDLAGFIKRVGHYENGNT